MTQYRTGFAEPRPEEAVLTVWPRQAASPVPACLNALRNTRSKRIGQAARTGGELFRPATGFVCRLLLVACLAASAAAAPPTRARLTQIRIPLWMESKAPAGGGLSARDFRATLDGTPSRILNVQCPHDDLIILVVLDLSSGDLTLAGPAKDTLTAEIQKLASNTYVGLLRAQDGLQVLLDPTVDRDAAVHGIEQQAVSGKAGLLSTIGAIAGIADSMLIKSTVRVAVVYVTDGDVRNYREDFTNPVINSSDSHDLSRRFPETLVQEKIAQLSTLLAAAQAPVFLVDIYQRGDRLNEAYQNGLKQLAETTGGAAFFSRSTTEIPEVIRKCFETVTSHYSLTLALPEHVSARPQIRITAPETDSSFSYRTRIALPRR
jgi:hypothetical protein